MATRTIDEQRARVGAPRKPKTVFALALGICLPLVAATTISAHDARAAQYRDDPEGYTRDVIGAQPWDKPVEIMNALRVPRARVAVRSGHKVAKSHTAACVALWFYDCFPDARVVITCVTSRQVDKIVWREVRKLHSKAAQPIEGEPGELARTGMKSADFREIVGFTAKEAEAVAGISGENILYIVDEASGVGDDIFEAIEGNRAGGARILMLSNPTRTEGEHFEAFHGKKEFYTTFTISSEETPNVREGRIVIPGLATSEWVEEKRREWGPDSALYKIRVKGEHVLAEDGKILSVGEITEAEQRWEETPAEGRLHIGIDPAGPAGGGDESAFAVRRGQKIIQIITMRGVNDEGHLAHLLGIIKTFRKSNEPPPVVKLDSEGSVGARVYYALRAHIEKLESAHAYELVRIRSSEKAMREPLVYDRVRDELYGSFERWIKQGGAIPTDVKLTKELHVPEWEGQVRGTMKATSKDNLRKALGRSPDRADAAMLAVWEPSHLDDDSAPGVGNATEESAPAEDPAYEVTAFDPYGGVFR